MPFEINDPSTLPDDLPAPVDDGAADHLAGALVPSITLPSTSGTDERIDLVPPGFARRIVYAFPRMGRPGEESLTADWDAIPGARGCTPESCGFRDHAAELEALGTQVTGLSTQGTGYQREAVERLGLPYPLLSDEDGRLTTTLGLPTFEVAGHRLLKRLTLAVREGRLEHVFYPVFPPDTHAQEVLEWVRDQQ